MTLCQRQRTFNAAFTGALIALALGIACLCKDVSNINQSMEQLVNQPVSPGDSR